VNDDADLPKPAARFLEQPTHLDGVRHVGLHGDGGTTAGVDLVDDRRSSVPAAGIADDDRAAVLGEAKRYGATDAA
jgi:hypothetical protein